MTLSKFYITFGQNHPLRNGYVVVRASDRELAREAAFDVFGTKWAFLHDETEDMTWYSLGAIGEPIIGE
jgi:hypothetical protein